MNPIEISRQIRCVVVEDDPVALKVIETLIKKTPSLHLEQSFPDPVAAAHFLKANSIDLLFLDVEMPDLTGFDLLKLLDRMPEVIIVTANEKYALRAFDFKVHDFLIKPVTDYSRFLESIYSLSLFQQLRSEANADHIFVKADSLLHNVPLDQISFVEANGDYINLHVDGKAIMVLSTLKSIEQRLPSNQFVRVHRSYIVNLKKIENIDASNLQIGKKIIPLSASYRAELLQRLNLL